MPGVATAPGPIPSSFLPDGGREMEWGDIKIFLAVARAPPWEGRPVRCS